MERESVLNRIREIAGEKAQARGFEHVHTDLAGTKRNLVVRVFIDKPGGITLEDCSQASRDIEEVLDAEDLIPDPYVLEVSSPGIERQLFSIDDFRRFVGKRARIRTAEEINGRKVIKGRIARVAGTIVEMTDGSYGTVAVPYEKVAKANLVFDVAEEFGRRK